MKKWWVIYGGLGALVTWSYISIRHYLVSTPINNIVISNLTVNYLLLSFITGGVAGYLAWKKVKGRARLPATLGAVGLAAALFLAVMVAGGYKIR